MAHIGVAKTIQKAKESGPVLLWALVALLIWAAAAGESLVSAQTVEPTDTTAVPTKTSDEQDSGERSSHCPYGEYELDDGTTRCRACPQRTYWNPTSSNIEDCVPIDADPNCPRPLQANVSSWDHCVYIFCPPDPGNPNLLEHRNLSNGACTNLRDPDVCPVGRHWFPQYGGCRTTSCRHGRLSTGWCASGGTTRPTTSTGPTTSTHYYYDDCSKRSRNRPHERHRLRIPDQRDLDIRRKGGHPLVGAPTERRDRRLRRSVRALGQRPISAKTPHPPRPG